MKRVTSITHQYPPTFDESQFFNSPETKVRIYVKKNLIKKIKLIFVFMYIFFLIYNIFYVFLKDLINDIRFQFRNVSRIMDCVSCEKCRLWGKIQITGLGTALKVIFSLDG